MSKKITLQLSDRVSDPVHDVSFMLYANNQTQKRFEQGREHYKSISIFIVAHRSFTTRVFPFL